MNCIFKSILALLYCITRGLSIQAQSFLGSIGTQASLNDKWKFTVNAYHRTYDGPHATARWMAYLAAEYYIRPELSVIGGGTFILNHGQSKELDSGLVIDHYWQPRFRSFVAGVYRFSFLKFNVNYRLMYQVLTYDDMHVTATDGNILETLTLSGSTTHVTRNRIYIEYPFRKLHFSPYTYYELFNNITHDMAITQQQMTVGVNYDLRRNNRFGIFYRHIFRADRQKPADGIDVIGVSYQYRFEI